MKKTLIENTNFNKLKELAKILKNRCPLVLFVSDEAKTYAEFTSTDSESRFQFWWDDKKTCWEVRQLDDSDMVGS